MAETFDELYAEVVGDDDDQDFGGTELTEEELAPPEPLEDLAAFQEEEKAKAEAAEAERIRGEKLGLLTSDDIKKYVGDRRTQAMHAGTMNATDARKAADALLKRDDIPGPVRVTLEAVKADLELGLDETNELVVEAATAASALAQRIAAQDLADLPEDPNPTTTWSTDAAGNSIRTVRDFHGRTKTDVFAGSSAEELGQFDARLAAEEAGESGLLRGIATHEDAKAVTRKQLVEASTEEFLAFQEHYPEVVQQHLDAEAAAMDATHRAQGFG